MVVGGGGACLALVTVYVFVSRMTKFKTHLLATRNIVLLTEWNGVHFITKLVSALFVCV